jgi:hypothetical protein
MLWRKAESSESIEGSEMCNFREGGFSDTSREGTTGQRAE